MKIAPRCLYVRFRGGCSLLGSPLFHFMPKNTKNRDRKTRQAAMQKYYRKHPFCELDKCYYCGSETAKNTQGDHIPPISWAYALGFDYLTEKENAPFLIVPCCTECNNALGDKKYFTLNKRKGFIASHLRSRYRKLRESPMWTEDDLAELDGRLEEQIRTLQDQRLLVERRIAWAER